METYFQMLYMRDEVSLTAVLVLLLIFDLFAVGRARRWFQPVACVLMGLHIVLNLLPMEPISLFGGMYHYTPIMTVVKSMLSIGTLIVFMQSYNWISREDTRIKQGEFYVLTLATLLGMFFMISSGNFLMFFLGIELAAVPMAALVAFDKYHHHSYEAGAKYILSALFSTGLMVYGISMLYGTVGTLYFDDVAGAITGSPLQIMAFVFFFAGMAFKISLVPFHLWTADVYEGAPTNITAYLSVISKCSAAFVLMIVLIKVFGNIIEQWQGILYGVIIASITIANLFAIRQRNIKRFFAFSSISQAGYILLGVIGGTAMGMSSLVYYLIVYAAANLGVFGVISVIEQRSGKVEIDDYKGLYKTNPRLSVVMMLSLFSLAGIPPFAGFFSKFFIFMAAANSGYYLLVLIALLNTVISLFYYLLIIKAMFITENDSPIERFRSDNYTRISLVLCLAGVLALGLFGAVYNGIVLLSYGLN
ncbi:MAG: NADH-quinone oxidoreductase subunit N [Alistipes sp.]